MRVLSNERRKQKRPFIPSRASVGCRTRAATTALSAFPPARQGLSTDGDAGARAHVEIPLRSTCPPPPASRGLLARGRRGRERMMSPAANEKTPQRTRVSSRSTLGGRTTDRVSCSPPCSWPSSPSPRSSRWRTSPSSTPTRATRCDPRSPDAMPEKAARGKSADPSSSSAPCAFFVRRASVFAPFFFPV